MFNARNLCFPLEISVIFMVFGVCLHSQSHWQNERIYGDSVIFVMKSYMAFTNRIGIPIVQLDKSNKSKGLVIETEIRKLFSEKNTQDKD